MTDTELRTRIRALMAAGALPSDLPSIEHRGAAAEADIRFAARHLSPKLCSVCGDPDPQAALFYTGGRVVRVHAACEAIWQQEREGQDGRR